MPQFNISFYAGWSSRKAPMMARDLTQLISQHGAKHIVFKRVDDVEDPAPPELLLLGCRDCQKSNGKVYEGWRSQMYTTCPECGERESVYTMQPAEDPPKEPEPTVEEPDDPKPPVAATAVDGTKAHKHYWGRDNQCLYEGCNRNKPGRKPNAFSNPKARKSD